MKKSKAAYPAVDFNKADRMPILRKHLKNFVPCYVLIDAEGNLVAEGKGAALAKIGQL